MQSPKDVAELWAAIPGELYAAAMPRRMESSPEVICRPGDVASEALVLYCAGDWEGLRHFVKQQPSGVYQLSPRVGVVEWSPTEVVREAQYIVGARIYFQDGDVPWSALSSKLFSWMSRWMKKHYFLAPALRAPIAIGRHLLADIEEGKATAIYPNGEEVIRASSRQVCGGKV